MFTLLFSSFKYISQFIDAFQTLIARILKWLLLSMTLIICVVIVGRFFDVGSTALQESITYMHASLFMLTLAYTAYVNEHVRVDIIYRRCSKLTQAWIDLFGACIFLLPFSVFLIFISLNTTLQSWEIKEASTNPGGLPFIYLLKTLPPLSGLLLCLHALSDIAKKLCFISCININKINDTPDSQEPS